MDAKKRAVQHRSRRQEARNEEVQELRGENRQLQKQVSRLRKQLAKTVPPEPETEAAPTPEIPAKTSCGSCASTDVKSAKLPIGTFYVCQPCGKRWKLAL
jgi:hypothetical protein